MEPMAQRAREPYRVLGRRYPPEGVKALWAFHKADCTMTFHFCVDFFEDNIGDTEATTGRFQLAVVSR